KKNQRRKAKIRQMKEEHRDFVEGRAPRSSESDVGAQTGSPSQAEAVRQAAGEATQQLVQQRIKDPNRSVHWDPSIAPPAYPTPSVQFGSGSGQIFKTRPRPEASRDPEGSGSAYTGFAGYPRVSGHPIDLTVRVVGEGNIIK
ncbi:hypothetical protein V5O48_017681, partial [Marasmius crinis-equi]